MEKKTLAGRLELKLLDTGGTEAKTFSGYASYFANPDAYGDIVEPGAFTGTLAEHKANGTSPVMLWNHDAFAMPIGIWDALEEDDRGLKASGRFLDTSIANDAYLCVKAGAVSGLSIGYVVTGFEMERTGATVIRRITEVKLIEISVVTFPANDLARVSDVKSEPTDDEEFLKALVDLGVDAEDAKTLLAKRTKSDDDEEGEREEDVEPSSSSDASDQTTDETKYHNAARLSAVRNLIAEIQEYHGR